MKTSAAFTLSLALLAFAQTAPAYPLDAAEETGITRLDGYRLIQSILLERGRLKPGAMLNSDQIQLRLGEYSGGDLRCLIHGW